MTEPLGVSCGIDEPILGGVPHVRIHLLYRLNVGGPWVLSGDEAHEPVVDGDRHMAFVLASARIRWRYRVAVPEAADPSRDQSGTDVAIVRRRRERMWS